MNKVVTAGLILCCIAGWVSAAEVDAEAQRQLERMAAFYKNATGVRATIDVVMDITMNQERNSKTNRFELLMDKTGRIRCAGQSFAGDAFELVSNGSNLWCCMSGKKEYLEIPCPGDWMHTVGDASMLSARVLIGPLSSFLGLFNPDPYEEMMSGVTRLTMKPDEVSDGATYRVLYGEQEQINWSALIAADDPPLMRRMIMQPELGDDGGEVEIQIVLDVQTQEINPTFGEDDFVFTPPADAKKVESLMPGPGSDEAGPVELLGKEAPDGRLPLLDGTSVSLTSHRGKNVVVMDFWATWCPPCRRALPVLNNLAERWGGSNVVFYAVNRREDEKTIQSFMEKQAIDFPVVLDNGELAEAFGVSGIPHLVIVDASGIVQYVHVGFSSGMEEELDGQLARILAGESVAEETRQAWQRQLADKEEAEKNRPPAYQAKPIPSGPESVTIHDFRRMEAAFLHRMITEFYLSSRTSPRGEEEILPFLADYERFAVGSNEPVPTAQELVDRARALLRKGYDHPIIRYCLGGALREQGTMADYHEAAPQFQTCYALFSSPQYASSWRRYTSSIRLLSCMRETGLHRNRSDQYARVQQQALEALKQTLTDGSLSNINLRIVLKEVSRRLDHCTPELVPREDYVEALESIRDQIHPAICEYAQAQTLLAQAWRARGGGYASTVKEESWKVFHEKVDEAREHAEKAWAAYPSPEIASFMIEVARCRSKERNEWRKWFDEAVALQMDYGKAYAEYIFTIFPRWHGSHSEMIRFGEECLNTRRFDTSVPRQYEEIVHDVSNDSTDRLAVFRKPGVYSNLIVMLDGYLPYLRDDAAQRADDLSRRVIFAWASGHYVDAAQYLDELNAPLAPKLLERTKMNEPEIRAEVALFTSSHSNVLTEVRRHLSDGRREDAFQLVAPILEDTTLPQDGRFVIEDISEVLRVERAFETGESVSLMPPLNMAGWKSDGGYWSMGEDGTLCGIRLDKDAANIRMKAAISPRFELTGDFELKGVKSHGSLVISWPKRAYRSSFRIDFIRSAGSISLIKSKIEKQAHIPLTRLNQFKLLHDGGKLSLWVNERPVFEEYELPEDWIKDRGNAVNIGLRSWMDDESTSVGARNWKVRKLEEPAAR
ncbi:MAG: redoxin family protein [Kiritimatiellae bacterium]|nr:redoxin family protein [Kiritimatiellia bacterium]